MEGMGMKCNCGQETCSGLCNYAVGKRLATFISEIDTIETKIGDMDKSNYSKDSLIVTGLTLYKKEEKSTVLKPSYDVSIPMEERFKRYNDKNAKAILKEYINISGLESGIELINKMRLIEENRLVFVPFKPEQICDVEYTRVSKRQEINGKKVECRTKIESVKWSIVDNDEKLQCVLHVEMVNPDTMKRVRLRVQDYCNTFNLVDLDRLREKSNVQGQIIKMTKFGYIQPIEIKSGNYRVIIDNCNIYEQHGESTDLKVIGEWSKGKLQLTRNKITDSKVEKAVSMNMTYISKHRRWIAPYGLCETNKLTVK